MAQTKITPTLVVRQGKTLRASFLIDPDVNLSGVEAVLQIRKFASDTGAPVLEASTYNGGLSVEALEHRIDLYAPVAVTKTFTLIEGVFELVLIFPDGSPFSNDDNETVQACLGKVKGELAVVKNYAQ